MAQSGYTPILTYASGTATNVPSASNLTSSASGAELALNYADGKLYYKNSSGVVTLLANTATVAPVTTFSAGTTGFTPSSATSGAVTLAGTLVVGNGGTGLTTLATGSLSYGAGTSAFSTLAIGTAGQILTVNSGATAPQWSTLSGVAVTTLSFGTTGLTPSTATSGAITVAGTLVVGNGGTGLTSLTAGYIPFGAGTSAFGNSVNLFWDNTNARLGIGTNNPGAPLETQLFSTTQPAIRLRYSSTAYYGEHLMDPSGNYVIRSPAANGVTSGYLSLQAGASMLFSVNGNTYTSPAMAIDTTGQLNLYASSSRIVGGGSNAGRVILSNFDSTTYMIAYGSSYGSGQSSILTFVTSGTNIMTMSATGQFMVGGGPNNGQTYKLGVYSPATDVQLLINSDNGYNAYMNIAGYGGGWSTGRDGGTGHLRWNNATNFGGTQVMTLSTGGVLCLGTTDSTLSNRLEVVGTTSMIYFAGGNSSTNISSGTPDQMYYKITDATVGNFFQQAFINSGGSRMFNMGAIQTSTSANFNNGKFFIEGGAVSTPATFIVDATTAYTYCGYSGSNGSYRLQVNGQIFATNSTIATSDGRYKENVQDLTGALDLVNALRPVSFNWKKHNVHNFNTEDTTVGFIAQEVKAAMADKPYVNSFVKTNMCTSFDEVEQKEMNEEFMGFAETNMVAILTKALQELNAKFDAYVASHP